ncbi:MAG: hypothetical protein ABEJ79_08550 [Halolamina sp.]
MTRAVAVATVVLVTLATLAGGIGPALAATGSADDAARTAASDVGFVTVRATANESQPTVGENVTVTAHVGNDDGGDEPVVVDRVAVRTDDEVLAETEPGESVAPGETLSVGQSLSLDDAGERSLSVVVEFRGYAGDRGTVVQPLTVAVQTPHPSVSASVAPTVAGAPTTLNLSLVAPTDGAITDLELSVAAAGVRVADGRRLVGRVDAGARRTFGFDLRGNTTGTTRVTVVLAYTDGDGTRRELRRTLRTRFRAPANPGDVELTGLSVERTGNRLRVAGSASNVGGDAVESVVVAVDESDRIAPGAENARFFVGQVPASEFATFTVEARLTGDAAVVTVPLEVTYVVDGVRRTETVAFEYAVPPTPAPDEGGGPPVTLLGGGGVVALVVLAGGWRWARGG